MYNSPDMSVRVSTLITITQIGLIALLSISSSLSAKSIAADKNPTQIYDIGQSASSELIAGWDIDIRPDGLGLPDGSGSVEKGEELYDEKCAVCHGTFGEGVDRWPKLTGGQDTLSDDRPEKTVGSYWPYASTLWDYIHRAMPFQEPQSLSDNEVYAITAYVLNLNDIVDENFVLNKNNLAAISMPNKDGFYTDNRPDTSNTRCMSQCKDASQIKIIESLSGISPTDHFKHNGDTGVAYKEDTPTKVNIDLETLGIDPEAKQTYEKSCKSCHDAGLTGAPKLGVFSEWEKRIAQDKETTYTNAISGLNAMPPKGGRGDLSDDQIKAAVDYMLLLSQEFK